MRPPSSQHKLGTPFVLLVFCLFTITLLLVLLLGANVYRNVNARAAAAYDQRVCLDYLAAKLRHYDQAGMVFCADFHDPKREPAAAELPTLYLCQEVEGELYQTRVYFHDGYLRELFAAAGLEFAPGDGQAVLPADELNFDQQGRLITIFCRSGDQGQSLSLLLRSQGGAGR